jgi:hypothetical protein
MFFEELFWGAYRKLFSISFFESFLKAYFKEKLF